MATLHNLYIRNQWRKQQTTGSVTVSNKAEINLFFISMWDLMLDWIYTAHQVGRDCPEVDKDFRPGFFIQFRCTEKASVTGAIRETSSFS